MGTVLMIFYIENNSKYPKIEREISDVSKKKTLGLMVSEKKIFFTFSYYKSMGANDPRGMTDLDPSDMNGRIYVWYL